MRISFFLFMGMLLILVCCTSSKSGITPGEERKKIASFILIKNLPVYITTNDSTLGISLRKFMTDTLKAMGYKFITADEREILQKKFWTDLTGSKDAASANKERKRLKEDKDYYVKEMKKAAPLEQLITLSQVDSNGNRIAVSRTNFPGMQKKRKWLIPYEDSELVTTIASRIVDSLTAR